MSAFPRALTGTSPINYSGLKRHNRPRSWFVRATAVTIVAMSVIAARSARAQSPSLAKVAIVAPPSAAPLVSQLRLELGILGVSVTEESTAPGIVAIVVVDEAAKALTVEARDPAAARIVRLSIDLDETAQIRSLALQIVEEIRRILRQPVEAPAPVIAPPHLPSPSPPRAERMVLYVGAGVDLGELGPGGRGAVEFAWRSRARWIMSTEVSLSWPWKPVEAPEGSARLRGATATFGLRRALVDELAKFHVEAGIGVGILAVRIDGSPAAGYLANPEWAFAGTAVAKAVASFDVGRSWRLTAAAQAGIALPALRIHFAGRDVTEYSPVDTALTLGAAAVFR